MQAIMTLPNFISAHHQKLTGGAISKFNERAIEPYAVLKPYRIVDSL